MNEINLFSFIINLCCVALCGALLPILPALTRKSLLFGVKIPLEEHGCPEAKGMRKRYIAICLAGTAAILALCVVQYTAVPDMTLLASLYFPLLFIVVYLAAFVPNWKRAAALKEERGWRVSDSVFAETKSSHSRGNLSELPWAWYIAGFIIIFINAVIALYYYPSLPDRIPVHFDINMKPDAWADKSIWQVMMVPIMNVAMTAVLWVSAIFVVKAKLQIDQKTPARSFAQHRLYRKYMGHSLGFVTLCLAVSLALIGFATLWPESSFPFWVSMTLMLFSPISIIVVYIKVGQGGCNLNPKIIDGYNPENPPGQIGRGDDKYWALGIFYHNPDDSAHIVEDRLGGGIGFNYSRLPVKIGVAALILALIATYAWITAWLWPA